MYSLTDYEYQLPAELIAQKPLEQRDLSNLLVLDRKTGRLAHNLFHTLGDFLNPGDVLVINNTAVIPGRLVGKKDSGGRIEVLICDFENGCKSKTLDGDLVYTCLVKAAKPPKPGSALYFAEGLRGEVVNRFNGTYIVKFHADEDFEKLLYRIGQVPLPPYIRRRSAEEATCDDRVSYQTIYASQKGAIAAPTAGLHFTDDLLEDLRTKGVTIVSITLHVGYGTFLPVTVEDIRCHKMHSEPFSISKETADSINSTRATGNRVVAVGTTCVRTLEYASDDSANVKYGKGCCDLFIYPGYRFKVVDAMITNFHLPKSTLLMLVSAFAGRERVFRAYHEAIKRKYRFYSYGDAMLIV
jgi:S-adenosylmethionine:tRNA ribosyltransferase-isomerase